MTTQMVECVTLEGKQQIKIITGEVGAKTDRLFMIRDYQKLGLFNSCSLRAAAHLQAHNLVSFDRVWLSAQLFLGHLSIDCREEASDDSSFNKVHHCNHQVVHHQVLNSFDIILIL